MVSEEDCRQALQDAADRLGKSPTKAEYEELGLTPASATIIRVMGGWNAAKEATGLETYEPGEFGGTDVQPKPDDVEIPKDVSWEDLTGQQRWYYKNRERRIDRKDRRRAELRRWLHEYKVLTCSCERCGEGHPSCLDFHHVDDKDLSISEMIAYGYAAESIEAEIERCVVLCANCHRKEHYEPPAGYDGELPADTPS